MTPCDHLAVRGLERRELGLPDPHLATCATCQVELPRYDFMARLPELAAAHRAPPGWELGVWAAIDAMERAPAPVTQPWWRRLVDRLPSARWLLALAPVAAAVIVLVLRPAPSRPPLGLELEVRAGAGEPRRAVAAAVGDEIVVRAPGADAVWIYREGAGLVARCPAPEVRVPPVGAVGAVGAVDALDAAATGGGVATRCRKGPRATELTFRVTTAARYRFVAIRRPGTVEPTGDLDRDSLALHTAGASLQIRAVVVPW